MPEPVSQRVESVPCPAAIARGDRERRGELQDAEAQPYVYVAEHADPHEARREHGEDHEEEVPDDEQRAGWADERPEATPDCPEIPASPDSLIAAGIPVASLRRRRTASTPPKGLEQGHAGPPSRTPDPLRACPVIPGLSAKEWIFAEITCYWCFAVMRRLRAKLRVPWQPKGRGCRGCGGRALSG